MRRSKWLVFVFLALISASAFAQNTPNWETVLDWQQNPGTKSLGLGTIWHAGTLYSVGKALDADGIGAWIVQSSSDLGKSWKVVDHFRYADKGSALARRACVDLIGHVYVAGEGKDGSGRTHSIIRMLAADQPDWKTVDDYLLSEEPAKFPAEMRLTDLKCDGYGNVYALLGAYTGSDQPLRWVIRKSRDQGKTWLTSDSYVNSLEGESQPLAMAINEAGEVFVTGAVTPKNAQNPSELIRELRSLVRKSSDFGESWEDVDLYQSPAGIQTWGMAIAAGPHGEIVETGYTWERIGMQSFVFTRRSLDRGATWETVEKIPMDLSDIHYGQRLHASDGGNRMIQLLAGVSPKGSPEWLVRESRDFGKTWDLLDQYDSDGGVTSPMDLVTAGKQLFVTGFGSRSAIEPAHWLVRTSILSTF